jgi:flagellar basal-body rod modification protein FlgD
MAQSVQPTSSTTGSNAAAAALGSSGVPNSQSLQNEFIQLLTTQLQNQDPLNPVSSTDMVSQLAQISNLSAVEQLNSNFSDLLMLDQLTQGANLVGRNVVYSNGNATSQGTVSSATVQNGQLQLQVGDQSIALSQVQSVQQPTANSQ